MDLADTLDIKEVLKRNPCFSSEDIRCLFIEAAGTFAPASSKGFTINVDGASRGNPGKAGIGYVIRDKNGGVIKEGSKYIGIATNNVSEYTALIFSLEAAREMGAEEVNIYADSELVVKQINGEYRVRDEGLKPLYNKVISLLKGFRLYDIIHVGRKDNREADKLANQAIDLRF